jgi:hypothetical protein
VSKGNDATTRIWDVETGECLEIYEDLKQSPWAFLVESEEPKTIDLSKLAGEGYPVGVQCRKVQIHNDRACCWIGNSVHFFKLIGIPPLFSQEEDNEAVGLCFDE